MTKVSAQETRRVSRRLPFPTSVYIFNGFYDDPEHALGNSSLLQFLRDYSNSLLRDVRLDFVVREPEEVVGVNEKKWREHRLYSRTLSSGIIQPVWHHLNEQIDISEFSIDAYESMMLRFFVSEHFDDDSVIMWQQVPIHPSKLIRIAKLPQPDKQQLPLNFIVVEYSDKTLRTTFPLYRLLESKGKKEEIQKLLYIKSEGELDDDYFGRFKDNAFNALDQVSAKEAKVMVDEADLLLPQIDRTSPIKPSHDRHAKIDDSVVLCSPIKQQKEALLIQAEIEAQEEALLNDVKELDAEYLLVKNWEAQVTTKRDQIRQVHEAVETERQRGLEIVVKLQTQQIRLVRELQQIYPITVYVGGPGDARHRFRVRDLDFPATFQDMLMAPEDELSAVLGYTCHLVHMISKYLSVQLRYRLICHNSRSGIQDDRALLYPLFYGRNVDREQFERGFTLLQRNVDCVCRERDLVVAPKIHILGKLKRILEHVVDGY